MAVILYQWGRKYIPPVGDSISFILSPGETLSRYIVSEGETFMGRFYNATPVLIARTPSNNNNNKISSSSGDDREAFLFQRVSVLVQRFNAVLLHDSLPTPDCTD